MFLTDPPCTTLCLRHYDSEITPRDIEASVRDVSDIRLGMLDDAARRLRMTLERYDEYTPRPLEGESRQEWRMREGVIDFTWDQKTIQRS